MVQCTLVLIANPFRTLGISPKQYRFLARNLGMMALGEWVHSHHKTDRKRVSQKLLCHTRSNQTYVSYSKTKHEHMGRKFFHSRLTGRPMPDCWTCSQALQPNWANCPFCGTEGVDQNQCPQCEKHVENSWEFCPNCGYTKGSGNSEEMTPENTVARGFVATQPITQSIPDTHGWTVESTEAYNRVIERKKLHGVPEKGKSGFRGVGWVFVILVLLVFRVGLRIAATG